MDEKMTVKKAVIIALLTAAACVPGLFVYLGITLLLGPFFGSFSPIVSMLIIVVPLLIAAGYALKRSTKRRTEKRTESGEEKMGKIRHVIEALISAFLFAFQQIPVFSPMLIPSTAYLFGLWWTEYYFLDQMEFLLFSERLMFGRIVAVTGFVIFLATCVQFLFQRGKAKVVTSGLYSVVRHPQYFGIIVASLGITIMCLQSRFRAGESVVVIWLFQVLGYVLLAAYEEQRLMKEYEEEYQSYKQKAPFIFPVPAISKIPEPLVSLAVAYFLTLLLTVAL